LDELLFDRYVFLDLFEEQVDGFLFLVLDFPELLQEASNVVWWSDTNVVFLALIEKVRQFSLGVLT
jgi:hypothetical protein